jgi:hypothetical protein
MKFWMLFLGLVPSLALADIYKSVDADGHVTYSSAPIKGGKKILLTPPGQSAGDRSRSNTPHDFPVVNEETQKTRDGGRRKILDDELKTEQDLLNTASVNLQAEEGRRPRDDQKINDVIKQLDLHQANISALKTELSKLKQ